MMWITRWARSSGRSKRPEDDLATWFIYAFEYKDDIKALAEEMAKMKILLDDDSEDKATEPPSPQINTACDL